MKNKLFFLIFLSFISLDSYASDQFLINQTKSDVTVGYETCVFRQNGDTKYKCTQSSIDIPALSKILAPWPEGKAGEKNSFLIRIESHSRAFNPVLFLSHLDRKNRCGDEDVNHATHYHYSECSAVPILLSHRETMPFPVSGSQGPGLNGAWIIQDFGVDGFVTMTFHSFGASHMRS
tara:strand:+ start:621 stop:1151 length:531 start_codon:yes stop_codon:yes gene_type:complete